MDSREDSVIYSCSYRNANILNQEYETIVNGLEKAYEIWYELTCQDSSLKRVLDICDSIVYEEFLSEDEIAVLDAIVDGVQQVEVDIVRGINRELLQEEIETLNDMFWDAIMYFSNR